MKKIIKDAILTLKYLLISFVASSILTLILYLTLSANEIQRYHYLYSNFVVFYYLLMKINIIVFALLPISLIITAFIAFSYAGSRDSSSIGSAIGLIIFCMILFGSLYIIFFQQTNRINVIMKLYRPILAESIPFIHNGGIVTYPDYQFYFENRKAYYYYDSQFIISDIKIDLKKNILTIQKLDNGIGRDFKYLDEVGQIKSLSFLKPIVAKVLDNFDIMRRFLESNKGIYFIIYLFAFFFVISWIPFLLHNESWPFPFFVLSFLIIILFAILFLATFKFSIVYLKDLKISKTYIYYFPAAFFAFIFIFEALLLYIKYSRKIFHSKIQQTKKQQLSRKGKI